MDFPLVVYYYLWVAPHLLLVPAVVLMFRRGLHKDFPIFFSYLIFEFVQFIVLFSLYIVYFEFLHYQVPPQTTIIADLIGRTGSIALHFGILQELFEWPVAHNPQLRGTTARMLKWVSGILIVVALLFIGSLYYHTVGHRLVPAYATLEALNLAQCGVIVFIFLWYQYLGLRMTPFVFGIVLGTGVTACSEPLIHAWSDSLAFKRTLLPNELGMVAFHLTVLIWLYYAYAQKKIMLSAGSLPTPRLREFAANSERIVRL